MMGDDYGNELIDITTEAKVNLYEASHEIFAGIFAEVRTLSAKKPETTLSVGKVKLINRVLNDLLVFLKDLPEGKYLDALDDEALPQASDAVLTMVQFETALEAFPKRYMARVNGELEWITDVFITQHEKEMREREEEEEEDDVEVEEDDEPTS